MIVAVPRMSSLLDHLYNIRYGIGEPDIMMYVLMAASSGTWRSGQRRAVVSVRDYESQSSAQFPASVSNLRIDLLEKCVLIAK